MTITLRKRGRPSKAELAMRTASPAATFFRSDDEVLVDLEERFSILSALTEGVVCNNVRALTVTGAPGVGKTYTVEQILDSAKESNNIQYEIVRGTLSAINLYKMAYRLRNRGSVLVLDDADSIFNDEEALNILKALCDSSAHRKVSWAKESRYLEDEDVPRGFEFNGAVIFISNLDFQRFVDEGKNKYAQHFEALMSRSMYLDLRLHTRAELGVWVEHVAKNRNIFTREEITSEEGEQVLDFLREHRNNLRELSIRTLLKTIQLLKTHDNWRSVAKILLTKP